MGEFIMTKYEYTKIKGLRIQQLVDGIPPFVKIEKNDSFDDCLTLIPSKPLSKKDNKYWDDLILMSENEHAPFETPLHKIFEKELCISPIPSLAMHCTNVNSIFGLSPNMNWSNLWNENEN